MLFRSPWVVGVVDTRMFARDEVVKGWRNGDRVVERGRLASDDISREDERSVGACTP